ncbi:hypothetical protein [Microbulbifer taiwanensis]|uniref:Uncharacterized protein n=1 Tax=Microbulbifer taiwanensis TaxID=986746 RepID=A0ABW1YGC5_9GAMM|nr:hypothetical protein [Microbulbifer taiwanensis]
MDDKLTEIRQRKAETEVELQALAPAPDLSDIDQIASKRAQLREKLTILERAEKLEQERLAAEAAADRAKSRKTLLEGIADAADQALEEYNKLTNKAVKLIDQLARTLADREDALTPASIGLDTPDIVGLLSTDDRHSLRESLKRSVVPVGDRAISATWVQAVMSATEDMHLRRQLLGLIPSPGPHGKSLSAGSAILAETARGMASRTTEEQPATTADGDQSQQAPAAPVPGAVHQQADLRAPAPRKLAFDERTGMAVPADGELSKPAARPEPLRQRIDPRG